MQRATTDLFHDLPPPLPVSLALPRDAARVVADLRLDLNLARAELLAMHEHNATLARRLEDLQAVLPDVANLHAALTAERVRNATILASTSWRITAPLRSLGGLVKRLLGRQR